VALAEKVRQTDDQVDAIYRGMYALVEQKMRQNPDQIDVMVRVMSVTRQIERLADHTVNIAKDVVYLATGQIVRHRGAKAPNGAAVPRGS
jgi:phosphate transport system protein